jgi:hypothetical protein
MGLVGRRTGSVMFNGNELIGMRRTRLRAGHRLLPGGARHLRRPDHRGEPDAAAVVASGGMTVEEIYELFPNLLERRAQPRHPPVRRRAADAGDGAHPAHRRHGCCCSTRSPKAWRR